MSEIALTPELRSELATVAAAHGCELVRADFGAGLLRLVLDRESGIGLEDCAVVSREVSTLLDVAGFGRGRYTLEVSSPGLDRTLERPQEFERFSGRTVRVRYLDRQTGKKATVEATLTGFRHENGGFVELVEPLTKRSLAIQLADVETARLKVEQ